MTDIDEQHTHTGTHDVRGLGGELFKAIVSSVAEGILTVDETQTIVMANPAAEVIFRRPIAELVGLGLGELMPARFRDRHAHDVRAFDGVSGHTRRMGGRADVVGLRANGEEFLLEASISMTSVDGARFYTAIIRDVTEDRERQRELAESHQALGRLIAAYDTAQETERKRIAREIHDDLQQTLAAIKLYLGVVADHLDDPARVTGPVEEARRLVGEVADSTRRIVNDLRPSVIERGGLVPALEALAERFTAHTGIASDVVAGDVEVESLRPDIVDCLYRVAQEALNNAAKHSQARRVAVELSPGRPGWLVLAICDDGKGIAMEDHLKSQSFGIVGLHERVAAVGGVLEIEGTPGEGTRVAVEVCMT